jgi:hypothetical protein
MAKADRCGASLGRVAIIRGAPKGSWLEEMLAGSQTAHAGDGRARQQDGADHLGATCQAGKTTELRSQPRREPGGPEVVADVVGRRTAWRNSRRDGRKNQMYPSRPEHAFMIWFPVRELPHGPAAPSVRQRPDGSVRLCANLLQKTLAFGGASTDEYSP